MKPIRKLLAANRSEIATRVFRSAHELGIRTVAIYSHEDRFALHRFKADEAYQIGKPGEPIRSYLDIAAIVKQARAQGIKHFLVERDDALDPWASLATSLDSLRPMALQRSAPSIPSGAKNP